VDARTRLINELRWQLHDLWPEYQIPKRALIGGEWQTRIARRLRRAQPTVRVRIATDMNRPDQRSDQNDQPAPSSARGAGQRRRAATTRRAVRRSTDRREADRRDRRDRSVQQRRAARQARGVRADPGQLRAHRPPSPGPGRQPAAQPRDPHARSDKDPPRPARRSTSPNSALAAKPGKKPSATSSAISSGASTSCSSTPTAHQRHSNRAAPAMHLGA
jgi:hypothetical protein